MIIKNIYGGVCAAKGFTAAGIHCGIRANKSKKDLALIKSEVPASAAATYTTNIVKGAPIYVTQKNISNGKAQAILVNSGNANTCNANGIEIAEGMCSLLEKHSGISASDVIVASTGVIGQVMTLKPFEANMAQLVSSLGDNSKDAAAAIMTTDTIEKELAVTFKIDGKICCMGGIAKGSGMINPNMATMLVFLTTDVAISSKMLQKALSADVKDSFNMISVDGDTSTNDMCSILANGMAGNTEITADGSDFDIFCQALNTVTTYLCRSIAKDGEGATKLLECTVSGADSKEKASIIAKSVIKSNLLKAAMFGADANWGRVLCAIGYSGVSVDISKIDVAFASSVGKIEVCQNGTGLDFCEATAKKILLEDEIIIYISLHEGTQSATAWGCDLTYDYVKINGDYRS